MSILLEALRKSERHERLGEVPNIHQDEQSAGQQGRTTRRPVVFVLLLLVALILGWLFWRQYAPPPPAPPIATATPEQPVEETGEPPVVAIPPPAQLRPAPVERSGPRTPMEAVVLPPVQTPVDESGVPLPDSQAAARTPLQIQREIFARQNRPAEVTLESAPVEPGFDAAGPVPTNPEPSNEEPVNPEPADRGLEPISFWELPEAIRSTLPPMKISVLVYAEQAAERFVLMDGRRRVEGDEVTPGLELIEVRRDGAVMSYQAYRFLVRH